MKNYLLSVYQPEPAPGRCPEKIMQSSARCGRDEGSDAWVFSGA
jgi:hypothetical protein